MLQALTAILVSLKVFTETSPFVPKLIDFSFSQKIQSFLSALALLRHLTSEGVNVVYIENSFSLLSFT